MDTGSSGFIPILFKNNNVCLFWRPEFYGCYCYGRLKDKICGYRTKFFYGFKARISLSATWVTFQQKYLKVMVHCFKTWWLNDFYNEPCHFKFRLFTNFSFLEIYDPQRELRIWFSILSNWNFCKGIHIFFQELNSWTQEIKNKIELTLNLLAFATPQFESGQF